jgi:hypothetical protein
LYINEIQREEGYIITDITTMTVLSLDNCPTNFGDMTGVYLQTEEWRKETYKINNPDSDMSEYRKLIKGHCGLHVNDIPHKNFLKTHIFYFVNDYPEFENILIKTTKGNNQVCICIIIY